MVQKQLQVLVVEDNPTDVILLREALAQDRLTIFDLDVAEYLNQALERLQKQTYAAILIDLNLPDSQGLATFLRIRQAAPALPMVVLSGLDDDSVAQQAIQAGAQDYLVKGPQELGIAARTIRYAIERQKWAQSLKASEQRFATAFHQSPASQIITTLEEGRIIDVNQAFSRMLGYKSQEIVGRTTSEINLWADLDERSAALAVFRQKGCIQDQEVVFRTLSGELRNILASVEPIEINGEQCVISTALDITARKQTEDKLRESENRFATLFRSNPVPVGITRGVDFRIFDVNEAWSALTGYTRDAAIGHTATELGLATLETLQHIRDLLHVRGEVRQNEILLHTRSGQERHVIITSEPIELNGEIFVLNNLLDVTERKKAEAAVKASEERLRLALKTTSDGFWIVAADRHFVDVNPAYCEMTGYTREEFLKLSIPDVEAVEDTAATMARIRKISESGSAIFETQHRRKNGSIFDVEVSVNLLDAAAGLMICFIRDITARKRAETLLNQRLQDHSLINRLNEAVNQSQDIVSITELLATEMRKIFGSQYASVFLVDPATQTLVLQQYTMPRERIEKLESLIGRPIPKIDLPIGGDDHFSQVLNSDRGLLMTGPKEIERWLADFINTSYLPARARPLIRKFVPAAVKLLKIKSVISIPLKTGKEILGLIEFVTDGIFDENAIERLQNVRHQLAEVIIRTRAEQSLRESNEKYRLLSEELDERVKQRTAEVQDLYDKAPTGYHSLDANGRFLMVNQTELNWLGYTKEELIGLSFVDIITPDSQITFQKNFPLFKQHGWVRDLEFEMVRKDGSTFPVLVSATAIKDKAGNLVMSRSTMFDNTERKQAEQALRKSESRLRQSSDKLSLANAELEKAARMKDEFLASMSHELRTPLTGILGLSEALQFNTYGTLTEKQSKALKNIEESGRHLLTLINDILDLSKIEAGMLELNIEPLSLVDICQASLQLTKGMAQKKRHSVDFSITPSAIYIRGDARRLKQMLVNLLSNAVKFTPEGGALGLDVQANETEQVVRVTVWDTGIGIAPENIEKLFQPFVQLESSLARQYEGSGLGLSLVQHMAELHGGSVQVESTPGAGSRFTIQLPWSPHGTQPLLLSSTETGALQKALIVDDSELDSGQLARYLRILGMETITHPIGQGTVEAVVRNKPGLILLDLHLPDLHGFEVLAKLKANPQTRDTPVIIYSVEEKRSEAISLGAAGYLMKPLTLTDLRTELNRVAAELDRNIAARPAPDSTLPMILVVDDNEMIIETLVDFLVTQNFHVTTAHSGREMLEVVSGLHPDIILMDIQMPGMDGLEAIRRIRAHPAQWVAGVPVIAITALAMTGDRERCLAVGANAYMSKPVGLKQLAETIRDLLGKNSEHSI